MKNKKIILLLTFIITFLAATAIGIGYSWSVRKEVDKEKGESGVEITIGERSVTVSEEDYNKWEELEKDIRNSSNVLPDSVEGVVEQFKMDFFKAYLPEDEGKPDSNDYLSMGRESGMALYEEIETNGTEEWKNRLSEMKYSSFFYPRKMLVMTGDIKEDADRITLKGAEEICANLKLNKEELPMEILEYMISLEFNKYAMVCDLDGGSGIYRREYWMDENGNDLIRIGMGSVQYVSGGKTVKTIYTI